ncbi:MAG: HlyD family efflux transporter periplasmic adaptor subunit [Ruminococcus sp.]|nr:HlyD family efflux transporter periplasmic adaptor subunit [Ruminococcus sp.]
MKNKKILTSALLLSAMAISSTSLTSCGTTTASAPIRAFKLEKQELLNSISATGSVDGVRIDVKSEQNTKAIKVNVREGDYVEKGDVLFEFDSTDLKEKYNKLSSQYEIEDDKIKHEQSINEDNLNSAKQEKQALLSQAQRKIDEAVSARDEAVKRRETLSKQYDDTFDERNDLTIQQNNSTSDEEYNELEIKIIEATEKLSTLDAEIQQLDSNIQMLENAVNDARDNYSNQERQLNEAISNAENTIENGKFVTNSVEKDELKELKKQMESCVVTAPVSGVIVAPQVIEGSVPMSEILVTIVDTSDLYVNVNISEYDISSVNKDMDVIIKTAATDTDEINGTIKRISHINTNSEAGVTYPVEIDIDEKTLNKDLYIGMTARTEIISSRTADVFAVPYDSFSEDITNPDDLYIMVAEPDGDSYVTRKINVEMGEASSYYVEIISDELEEDMIIISEPTGLKDGQKINVTIE